MSTIQERIETVLSEHTTNSDGEWCALKNCTYEFGAENFHEDMSFEEAFARHLHDVLAPLIREAQAKVLTEFADAHRMPEPLFMDDGRAVTVGDLLREKAAQLRSAT